MNARGRALKPGTPERMTWRVDSQGTSAPLDAHGLQWAAGIARVRGDDHRYRVLRARAQRLEWFDELDRLARWQPTRPAPVSWPLLEELGAAICSRSVDPDHPSDTVSESSGVSSAPTNSDTRPCGFYRFGRKHGTNTFIYKVKCGRRTCTNCGPKVIAAKVKPLPQTMFAIEIERADWPTLERKLNRWRARGDLGDFVRIPLDAIRLLIASDAAIGNPIARTTVRDLMLDANPADGQITASKAWQPNRDVEHSEGFEDRGRVSAPIKWVVRKARQIGIPPEIHGRDIDTADALDFGPTDDVEHDALRRIAGVESDADFWASTRVRRSHGDTLARMTLARAA